MSRWSSTGFDLIERKIETKDQFRPIIPSSKVEMCQTCPKSLKKYQSIRNVAKDRAAKQIQIPLPSQFSSTKNIKLSVEKHFINKIRIRYNYFGYVKIRIRYNYLK